MISSTLVILLEEYSKNKEYPVVSLFNKYAFLCVFQALFVQIIHRRMEVFEGNSLPRFARQMEL